MSGEFPNCLRFNQVSVLLLLPTTLNLDGPSWLRHFSGAHLRVRIPTCSHASHAFHSLSYAVRRSFEIRTMCRALQHYFEEVVKFWNEDCGTVACSDLEIAGIVCVPGCVLNGHKAHYDYVISMDVSKIKIFIPYRVSKINLRLISQPNEGAPQQWQRYACLECAD